MKIKKLLLATAFCTCTTLYTNAEETTWQILADTNTPELGLPQSAGGRMVWGDYNNDGHLDVFIIAGQGSGVVGLWKNNGDGTFTKEQDGTFTALHNSSAIFIDYNNDGNTDLITTGIGSDSKDAIYAYKNGGSENAFAYTIDQERTDELKSYPVNIGSNDAAGRVFAAVDYDNDGWTDLMICGKSSSGIWDHIAVADGGTDEWAWRWRFTGVFRNNNGSFERKKDIMEGKDFIHTESGSIHVGDVNGDGYADILAQGYSDVYQWNAKLYINNGDGTFSISPYSSELNGSQFYESVFVDVNGDGYDDIVEISKAVANVHISDGIGGFSKIDNSGLITALNTSITAGDINNDGLVDLLVSGTDGDGAAFSNSTKIFYNNGDNTFTPAEVPGNMQARSGSVNLVNITNDNNLDYATFGYGQGWCAVFAENKLNDGAIASNTPPTLPGNFAVQYGGGKFSLSWDAATDAETAGSAIRYNVYAKNSSNGQVYMYAPASIETGKLKKGGDIVTLINQTSFQWNLPAADYTFGVQAVDQADIASEFTTFAYTNGTSKTCDELSGQVKITGLQGAIEISNSSSDDVTFALFTVNGQTINSGTCGKSNTTLLSSEKGIYLIKISRGKNVYTDKIFVF